MKSRSLLLCTLAAVLLGCPQRSDDAPKAPPGETNPGSTESAAQPRVVKGEQVALGGDGETGAVAPPEPRDRAMGERLAAELLNEWQRKHPDVDWAADEREAHALKPAFDNSYLIDESEEQTYGRVTKVDVEIWKRETERFALAGSKVFHSSEELGSTVAVSCDMCHPHGANTHPETYPKFQTQMGRVALLRDMINWCLEHPVRGKRLDADDPRMRALEAYIIAQRAGNKLAYGKH